MKRTSIAALTLLASFATLAGAGCSSEASPDTSGTTAGSATNAGGTAGTPTAGTASTSTAGTPASVGGTPAGAGTATGGTATAGTTTGGNATAGTATGGSATAGTATGGSSAGGAAAGAASGGTGGTGTANPACPAKIDSAVMCTSVIACPGAVCGAFKLGAKDCKCEAATGPFTCTSCSYAGKTESIVQKPAEALPACTADDTTLEKNTPTCTKGDRCASQTPKRFCACWDDPAKDSVVWDCDAMPAEWQ